jgi:acetyl esterase
MGAAWAAAGDLAAATPAEARAIAETVRAPWTRGGPQMARITERTVAGVRTRFYEPRGETLGTLVYLHGGGWTLFSLDTHDRLMRETASRAQVTVVGVDYALSPEAKFPVALEQIAAVVRALHESRSGPLAIGGDSAGANLSVAAAMLLRDRDQSSTLGAMLLHYGVFARHSSPEAVEAFGGEGNMLTAAEMDGFWRDYLRGDEDASNPLACPIEGDLHRLPPAFLTVPELDLLAEQSLALASRLREAGVVAEVQVYAGATHSFLEAVSISSLADRALDDGAAWLRRTLAR